MRHIDFTGGEPTLARAFVRTVSREAARLGMRIGIVTAAHWAKSDASIHRTLREFDAVDSWDVSTDRYHIEFVPLDQVERAFLALRDDGRCPLIRVAHHEPLTIEDAEVIDRVHRFAGRSISFQPIGPVGRGANLTVSAKRTRDNYMNYPCPTTGLLIRANGRAAPCCAPLSHEIRDHPLWLGDAFSEPLDILLHRWRTNALLQTIRLWGFGPLFRWLDEEPGLPQLDLRERSCDTCVGMLTNPQIAECVSRRSELLDHRIRVAWHLMDRFDETWLDEQLRLEATKELSVGII